jgi:hypothetical protein
LSGLVDLIRTGLSFAHPGIYEGVIKDLRIGIGDVHSSQHEFYLGYAMSHSRITGNIDEFRAVQVFWPDSEGHLPNEVESDQSVSQMQPRLDREATQSEIEAFRRRWWK